MTSYVDSNLWEQTNKFYHITKGAWRITSHGPIHVDPNSPLFFRNEIWTIYVGWYGKNPPAYVVTRVNTVICWSTSFFWGPLHPWIGVECGYFLLRLKIRYGTCNSCFPWRTFALYIWKLHKDPSPVPHCCDFIDPLPISSFRVLGVPAAYRARFFGKYSMNCKPCIDSM